MMNFSKYIPAQLSVRRVMAFGFFVLCAMAAWMRGGLYKPLQWPLIAISLFLCSCICFLEDEVQKKLIVKLKRDPIVYAGLTLLLLILIQCLNSNYAVVSIEEGAAAFLRSPACWLPWSVNPADAGEMLIWFLPAWVAILLVRHLLERRHIKFMVYLMAWNAALLSIVSIVQYVIGSGKILGMWEASRHWTFGMFDYPNHTAAWFYLNAFLSAGLLHDAMRKRLPPAQLMVWSVVFFLCLISAGLTLSRFGAFVAMALLGVILIIFLKKYYSTVKGAAAVNLIIGSVIAAFIGLTLFFGAGKGALAREISQKALVGESSVAGDIGGRFIQFPYAWAMFRDYPLFGSGGWSYRSLAPLYIPEGNRAYWDGVGKDNLHCDPLQFLTEFGLLGTACIAFIIGILIKRILNTQRHSTVSIWIIIGLFTVLFHSFFDLPFRCPAIVFEWCILLTILPKLSRRQAMAI
ncbi:MAG: O-antigen ligase family protein [Pontiella sp.]